MMLFKSLPMEPDLSVPLGDARVPPDIPDIAGPDCGQSLAIQARCLLEPAVTLPEILSMMASAKTRGARTSEKHRRSFWAATLIEAQAKAGELLREMAARGERDRGCGDRKSESQAATPKLDDLGVTKSESSRWQQLAELGPELRQRYVRQAVARDEQVSVTGLLRYAAASTGRRQLQKEASRRLRAYLASELRHLDRVVPLTEEEARLHRQWRDRIEAQLGWEPLPELIERAGLAPDLLEMGFQAVLAGAPCGQDDWTGRLVTVRAVLERTCVVSPAGVGGEREDRVVVTMWEVFADGGSLRWRSPRTGEGVRPGGGVRAALKQCSDCKRGAGAGAEFPYPDRRVCRTCWAARQARRRQERAGPTAA